MQQNNNLTELFAIILAGLLALIGAVLLYLGKIDYNGALALWGIAAGAFGFNLVYKAPSPAQQAQQNAQQQNVQQLLSQALAVLPVFASLLHSHTPAPQVTMSAHPVQAPQAPVAPPQPVQTAAPMQPAMQAPVQSSPPVVNPAAPGTSIQTALSPAGTATASFVAPVTLPTRDAWSNSSLMQAIGKPPQQG